jgi:phage repressor protein C with HTH and peptisase S24 domain
MMLRHLQPTNQLTPDKPDGYCFAVRAAEEIGDAIRRERKRLGMTQSDLAAAITRARRARDAKAPEASLDTISRMERGENTTIDSIEEAAIALGSNAAALLVSTSHSDVESERFDVSDYTPNDIPVIAEGEASPQGTLFWDDEGKLRTEVERRISRPGDINDPRAYGVQVRGDSMSPRYIAGELLIVSPNVRVRSGAFAYVELLSGERLLKRVHRQPGGWNLESLNTAYPPRFVRDDEVGVMHKIMYGRSL